MPGTRCDGPPPASQPLRPSEPSSRTPPGDRTWWPRVACMYGPGLCRTTAQVMSRLALRLTPSSEASDYTSCECCARKAGGGGEHGLGAAAEAGSRFSTCASLLLVVDVPSEEPRRVVQRHHLVGDRVGVGVTVGTGVGVRVGVGVGAGVGVGVRVRGRERPPGRSGYT